MSLMDKVYEGASWAGESVGRLLKKKENFTNLSSPQILEIGQAINQIYRQNSNLISKKINLPEIAVVGTQSSGKSSVLNGILSMDLLPTGGNMVTRVPLNISLIQTSSLQNKDQVGSIQLEFGDYKEGQWNTKKQYTLTSPQPTNDEIQAVRKMIDFETKEKAGNNMGISFEEINIRIYSPYVPSLTLTDLPGLTVVPCTDRGQPEDIPQQIEKLITKYIERPQTIILAVMASRTDLETDLGLGLVKKHDSNGQRTIGCLTKIDLMNVDTDICDYLYGNQSIPSDLRLKYGYFALRNRTSREMEKSPLEGRDLEMAFFNGHPKYRQMLKDEVLKKRFGITSLGSSLSEILTESIKNALPDILKEIIDQQLRTEEDMKNLGKAIPETSNEQISYLHNLIERINRQFNSAIHDKGQSPPKNTGRIVRDHFINYRENVLTMNPFDPNACSDEYLMEIIKNAEGNHMSFPTPPIEVLEHTLQSDARPIKVLLEPSLKLLSAISQELIKLLELILSDEEIARFPQLKKKFKDAIIHQVITLNQNQTAQEIEKFVKLEEGYIWTEDQVFKNELMNLSKGDVLNENQSHNQNKRPGLFDKNDNNSNRSPVMILRRLLRTYFLTVQENFQHNIPKTIQEFLINDTVRKINATLFLEIRDIQPENLLKERPEQETKRNKLKQQLKLLISAREKLEGF